MPLAPDEQQISRSKLLVEMHNIHKRFGPLEVLKGVNLSVERGEVIGLIGDNGAGKSTLMKVLAGAVHPDSGSLKVDGVELEAGGPREARELGVEMVYQDLALCDDLDVAANLFLGREVYGKFSRRMNTAKMHEDAQRDLSQLHIRISDTKQEVGNMSGGQRQAIAIARAVTFSPKVLVLDEPTAALAAREVEMVLKLIKDVSSRGVSVILITHRLQDLFEVADRLVVLYEGAIHQEFEPSSTTLSELVDSMMGK